MRPTAGASAARLGGGRRNSRRQGVPWEEFQPGDLAFPQISAPRAPLAPCFHPPETLLSGVGLRQNSKKKVHGGTASGCLTATGWLRRGARAEPRARGEGRGPPEAGEVRREVWGREGGPG